MISLCSCKQLLYTDIYVHKYCYCMRSRTDCDLLCVCITSFTVWKNNIYIFTLVNWEFKLNQHTSIYYQENEKQTKRQRKQRSIKLLITQFP